MSNFQIIKENERFALYQDNVLINTYTRKDSAVRRMKKIQSAEQTLTVEDSNIQPENEGAVSNGIISGLEVCDFISLITVSLSNQQLTEGCGATEHALTQRSLRGAARVMARSPP